MKMSTVAVVAGGAALVAVATVTSASATASSANAQTCAAFRTWDHHRTNANLDTMMRDSFAAPWKYIAEDAASVYGDARSGSAKYLASDIKYMGQDCSGK